MAAAGVWAGLERIESVISKPAPHYTRPPRASISEIEAALPPRKRRHADPRNEPPPPPALVRARLMLSRVVPKILTVPCPEHDADVGEYCFQRAHGVCAARIIARAARP